MNSIRFSDSSNFPPVVKNLIIINVLFFIGEIMLEQQIDLSKYLALYPVLPEGLQAILVEGGKYLPYEKFQFYQIFSHLFMHGNITHLLFNMFSLWMFGRILENVWGGKKFLLFYLLCGIGAALCHLLIQYFRCEELSNYLNQNLVSDSKKLQDLLGATSPAVGASGAVMGLLVAFAFTFPNVELFIMFIPIPVKAKWAVLGMAMIDLFGGAANLQGDNIAHFAHLGGALTGAVIMLNWRKNRFKKY